MTKKEKETIDCFITAYAPCDEDGKEANARIMERIDAILAFLQWSGNTELYEKYDAITNPWFKKYCPEYCDRAEDV